MKSKLATSMVAALGVAAFAMSAPAQDRPQIQPQPALVPVNVAAPRAPEGAGANVYYRTGYAVGSNTPFGAFNWAPTGEEANLAHEADQLGRQLAEAKSDSDRDKIKSKLSEILEKQFDLRQHRHESEIEALETQVKKLKELVQKRQDNRRDIIAKRLDQVVRDAQGLGW